MATATGNNLLNFDEVDDLDKAISVLFDCKPLPESQIKALCEKVSNQVLDRGFTLRGAF